MEASFAPALKGCREDPIDDEVLLDMCDLASASSSLSSMPRLKPLETSCNVPDMAFCKQDRAQMADNILVSKSVFPMGLVLRFVVGRSELRSDNPIRATPKQTKPASEN